MEDGSQKSSLWLVIPVVLMVMNSDPDQSSPPPLSLRQKLYRGAGLGSYGWLLIALMVTIFIGPMLQNIQAGVRFTDVVTGFVVVAGVMLATAGRVHVVIIGVIGSIMIVSSFVDPFVGTIATGVIAGIAGFFFLLYILVIILVDVFKRPVVSTDTLVGSVCGYLILAALFASVYSVAVLLDPDAFLITKALGVHPDDLHRQGTHFGVLTYYSVITLTTVGYGDIVPANYVTRAVVSVEAVSGQIYLTVIVARLVGLHLSHAYNNK